MSERTKGVMLSYVYIVVHLAVSLINTPLILHYAGDSEYGLYQIVASFVSSITIFETSIASGVLRFYCNALSHGKQKDPENVLAIAKKIYHYLSMFMVVIGVCLVCLFRSFYKSSFTPHEISEGSILLALLIVNCVIVIQNSIYLSSITANEKFVFIRIIAIGSQVSILVLNFLLLRFFPYAITVLSVQVVVNSIVAFIRYLYSRNILKVRVVLHDNDKKLLKDILLFSGTILLASLADQIFWKADQVILGKLYSTSIVAIYAIGTQVYNNYMTVGLQVSSVFFPKLSRLYSEEDGIEKLSTQFINVGRITYYIVFLVLSGFFIFGKEFVYLWVGLNYKDAYYIALLVMIPFTIDLIQHTGLSILEIINQYAFRAKIYLLSAVLNIISTIILAKLYGGIGAALSTGITMFITSGLVMNWYYARRVGLNIKRFWKEMAIITIKLIPLTVVAAFVNEHITVDPSWHRLIIKIIAYTIMYFALVYAVMNSYERNIVKTIIKI